MVVVKKKKIDFDIKIILVIKLIFFKVNIPTKYYFYLVGLPDLKAWGKKRSKFYGADISDDDIGKKAV